MIGRLSHAGRRRNGWRRLGAAALCHVMQKIASGLVGLGLAAEAATVARRARAWHQRAL